MPAKPFSNLAQLVYKRTYSRPMENGRLENWDDTVERAIAGNVKGHNVPEQEIKELLRLGKQRKAGPAGRGYWFSGTKAHSQIGGVALNNCFSGSEKFITKEYGSVSFEEVAGETVNVLVDRNWEIGNVRSFGVQSVQDVTFAPADKNGKKYSSNLRHTLRVTPDHGWYLTTGEKTNNLEVGDVVPSDRGTAYSFEPHSAYYNGFRHGLIFGDGTLGWKSQNGIQAHSIRLCDERTKKYVDMFQDITYPKTYNGDPVGRWDSYENFKEFPKRKNVEYLSGFLKGWLEADGNYSKSTARLSSQHVDALQWLKDNAASCGYLLSGYSKNNEVTNFGTRKNPLYTFTLSQEEMTWKVINISSLPEKEEVFCVTVPSKGRFTLASGIHTSNCWFLTGDDWRNYVIAQDLLMLGGGVGLSVEHRYTSKLPKVKSNVKVSHKPTKDADFIVPDSREGWCNLLYRTLEAYFSTGRSFTYSTVCIRGYGESIAGFGGTASGPLPLIKLIDGLAELFTQRSGKSLKPIHAADILTMIAGMVVAGNVRRSAIIILGDCWDKEYLKAKRWDLGIPNHRANANYSIVCEDIEDVHPLFWKTFEVGEAFGIVNRTAIQKYGRMGELLPDTAVGVNPCAEATLENGEPCNLVEMALCNFDDKKEFMNASRLMMRYGKRVTMEHYHHDVSAEVIARNRRVGIGITGCVSSPLFTPDVLDEAYAAILDEDLKVSSQYSIPKSIRHTVVKPSGTMGKVLDCAGEEGIHYAYAPYMIQRIRIASDDRNIPLLRAAGHHVEPRQNFDRSPDHTTQVVDFYLKAPEGTLTADKVSTWDQLKVVEMAQKHWADQAVSCTVYYRTNEIDKIKEHLANNLSTIKTISFMVYGDPAALAGFRQLPKEAITKEQYEKLSAKIKPINVDQVTDGSLLEGIECEGGVCPIR